VAITTRVVDMMIY